MKITRIITLLAVILSLPLGAQTVQDMLYNKSYEFSHIGFNVDHSKPFNPLEEDVTLMLLQGGEGKLEALNDAVRAMCREYIDNDALFKSVTDEADRRMARYNEIWGYEANDGSAMTLHTCKGLDVEVVSVAADRVLYQAAFYFKFSSPNNDREDEGTTVRHYYLGNTATGSLTRWQPSISGKSAATISNLVRDRFNEFYNTTGRNMAVFRIYRAYGENVEIDKWMLERYHPPIGDIVTKINLAEADIFWHKAGLVIQFQDYTAGSTSFKGEGYSVFFPYDEAIKIAAHIPELAYVAKLAKPAHNFANFDDDSLPDMYDLRHDPSPLSIAESIAGSKELKTLVVTNAYNTPSGEHNYAERIEYQFDRAGKLLSTTSFDKSNQMTTRKSREYTTDGRLKKTFSTDSKGKETQSMIPVYDSKGNIRAKFRTSGNHVSTHHYFYNGNNAYIFYNEQDWPSEGGDRVIEITPQGFCGDKVCYETNEGGDISAVFFAEKGNNMQIGRSKGGRLVEVHWDNDRYHAYYEYDSQGRIKQFSKYDDDKAERILMYEYGEGPYPNRVVMRTFTSGYEYSSEQVLEWSFFE